MDCDPFPSFALAEIEDTAYSIVDRIMYNKSTCVSRICDVFGNQVLCSVATSQFSHPLPRSDKGTSANEIVRLVAKLFTPQLGHRLLLRSCGFASQNGVSVKC